VSGWEIAAAALFIVPLLSFIVWAAFSYDHEENERYWEKRK
jgi:hypothetical protein